MIKVGSIFKAKDFEGYSVKILKKEDGQYRVRFRGPNSLTGRFQTVDDVVTEKYIRERYIVNAKK